MRVYHDKLVAYYNSPLTEEIVPTTVPQPQAIITDDLCSAAEAAAVVARVRV